MYRSGKAAAAQAGTLDILPVALLTLCPGTVCLAWAHLRKGVCVPCRRIPLRCLRSYVLGTLALPAEAVCWLVGHTEVGAACRPGPHLGVSVTGPVPWRTMEAFSGSQSSPHPTHLCVSMNRPPQGLYKGGCEFE